MYPKQRDKNRKKRRIKKFSISINDNQSVVDLFSSVLKNINGLNHGDRIYCSRSTSKALLCISDYFFKPVAKSRRSKWCLRIQNICVQVEDALPFGQFKIVYSPKTLVVEEA